MSIKENTKAPGVWLVYYADWSGASVFDNELEALRYAVEHSMQVRWVKFGEELRA